MAATPEAQVKKRIKELLEACGCVYSTPIGSSFGKSDMCDFIACVPRENGALYLEIEAKATPKDKPTARQEDKLNRVRKAGGIAWVINGENYDYYEEELSKIVGQDIETTRSNIHNARRIRRETKRRKAGLIRRRTSGG